MHTLQKTFNLFFSVLIITLITQGAIANDESYKTESAKVIALCKHFARKADKLEAKAFENQAYRTKGFNADFDALFAQYATGDNNRNVSGLNFRNPARYTSIKTAKSVDAKKISKTQYEVTFHTEYKWQSIRFILKKIEDDWKLFEYRTSPGQTPEGEQIWRSHKL